MTVEVSLAVQIGQLSLLQFRVSDNLSGKYCFNFKSKDFLLPFNFIHRKIIPYNNTGRKGVLRNTSFPV
jgi:hypothetical protein